MENSFSVLCGDWVLSRLSLILALLTLAKAWTTPNRRIVRKTSFPLICYMLVNAIEVKDSWAEKVHPFFTVVTSFIPRDIAGAKI